MIEKIVQTAKQTVNAIVDIQSARPSLLLGVRVAASRVCIHCSRMALAASAPDHNQKQAVPKSGDSSAACPGASVVGAIDFANSRDRATRMARKRMLFIN